MLTQSHREGLAREGYTVVCGLVPTDLIRAASDVITAFVNADLDRPETWYRHEPLEWSIVPVHQAQAFWDIRQRPTVHATFAALLGTNRLWVSMDRGVFKVPLSDRHGGHVDESVLHWDIEPRSPASERYQGMLFLTDVGPGEGAFECVPSIFRNLETYLRAHPGTLVDAPIDIAGHHVVEVPARAGDLVIWSSRLPHHGGRNRGQRPRVSMAVTMYPEGSDAERRERIECWQQKRAPVWWRGWKGQLDPEPGRPAMLSPLGRRLLGVDAWA
jgi:hypothetical protein